MNSNQKQVVILEHVPNETAGTMLDFLVERNISYQVVRLYEEGFEFPAVSSIRSLVVMGGPMNVYEEDKHPFLKRENLLIQEAIGQGIPYLGICLGAQLLAKALGASVYKAKEPEVGWGQVWLSREAKQDSLFSTLTRAQLQVLQWHEDTFDLPKGSVLLASSPVVPHQAYRYQDRCYGFQFHLEINRPMLEDWFKNKPEAQTILSEYDAYKPQLDLLAYRIYQAFFCPIGDNTRQPKETNEISDSVSCE